MERTGLFITLGVLLFVAVASAVLPTLLLVLMLLLPGRKGTLRTTREFRMPVGADDAFDLLAGRLEYDGFVVDRQRRPIVLTARREPRYRQSGVVTPASLGLGAEAHFVPAADGVSVRLAVWMNDFIFHDSGEGQQIDRTLDRLINAQLDRDPPPTTPSSTFNGPVAVAGGGVALALAALPPWLMSHHLLSFGFGVITGGLYAVMMGYESLKAIRARPGEVTGKPMAYVAFALGGLAVLAGATWVVIALPETLESFRSG